MKVFSSKGNFHTSPLAIETEDSTILGIYNILSSSKNFQRDIEEFSKKIRDPYFYQKLILVLTGVILEESTAEAIWAEIRKYHKMIVNTLGRDVHISAVVADYMLRVKNYLKNPIVVDVILMDKIKDSLLQDFVTGLYRGSSFFSFVEREINRSKRHGHVFSLLMLIVNGLENISLSGNTSVALKILVDTASIIRSSKRTEDLAFRFSLSKFGLILPQTDKKGAILFANRLLLEITNSILNVSGLIFGLTVSIGIQSFPDDGSDAETLISNTEKATYKSKMLGLNKIVYEL
ncbi:MAG: GGDEF domain-containing protein [Brevinematia bacterium]